MLAVCRGQTTETQHEVFKKRVKKRMMLLMGGKKKQQKNPTRFGGYKQALGHVTCYKTEKKKGNRKQQFSVLISRIKSV